MWTEQVEAGDFEAATESLLRGEMDAAIAAYESLLAKGVHGSAIYSNLGYALQKKNKLALAALNYYRALMLNPRCTEAKSGLNQLCTQASLPEFPETWQQKLAEHIPPIFLLIAGEVFFWIGALLEVRGIYRKKLLLSGSGLLLIGIAVFGVGLVSDPRMRKNLAIVTDHNVTQALAQPVTTAAHIGTLLPGTPVEVVSEQAPWSYCRLPHSSHHVGWIPTSSLSFVHPQHF